MSAIIIHPRQATGRSDAGSVLLALGIDRERALRQVRCALSRPDALPRLLLALVQDLCDDVDVFRRAEHVLQLLL